MTVERVRTRADAHALSARPARDRAAFWAGASAMAAVWLLGCRLPAADIVFDTRGFEHETLGEAPAGWTAFHRQSQPSVRVVQGGADESQRCLQATRTNSGGWTALSRAFPSPQRRILIEFSFAFSVSEGRSLNLWTHEPGGRDASQLNLCIEDGILYQYDGRTRAWEEITRRLRPTEDPEQPVWHRLRALVDAVQGGIDFWVSAPGTRQLPAQPVTRHAYRTGLVIGAVDLVSGQRLAPQAWYRIDDLVVTAGTDLPAPHDVAPLPGTIALWGGPPIPADVNEIPFVAGVRHQTIHRAAEQGYKFLHGAAIVHHKGVLYANWANSPAHENGPDETLQGRRSADGGTTWSDVEVIGPGFDGPERHSHGVLFVHDSRVWTICSRFGAGTEGRRFPGLKAEAFRLNEATDRWESRGVVMHNCWPYDQPVRMADGNYITGGQDKDGLPVVAISRGNDMTQWDSVLIPFDPRLKPVFAETTVWAEGRRVLAVIRGGGNVAWVATSNDNGRTWTKAAPSNFPMPRAKAYLGRLSTGQPYLLSNLNNRDTLVISVGEPGAAEQKPDWTGVLTRMWRVRHGKSGPPRFAGRAKGKQWSYPYGYEHDGKLFVVYSIGKEDCGLSILPVASLSTGDRSGPGAP